MKTKLIAVAILTGFCAGRLMAAPHMVLSPYWLQETNAQNEREAKRKAEEDKNNPITKQTEETKLAEDKQAKAAADYQAEQRQVQLQREKQTLKAPQLSESARREREQQYLKRLAEGHYVVPAGSYVISERLHDWFLRLSDERSKLDVKDAAAVEVFNQHAAAYKAAVDAAEGK